MPLQSDKRAVQLAMCLSSFLVPFTGSALNLAMPLVVRDFSMSAFFLTFLVSGYLVGTAMFQMPAARVGDLIGRRRLCLIGIATFAFFSLMSGLAWSGASLVAFRFGAGVGSAMIFATNMAILTGVFPKSERGRALGINTATVYMAVAVGPFLGGVLAHYLGWRSIFYFCAILACIAWTASWRSIRDEWVEAKGEPFDWHGAGVYVALIGGMIFGFSYLPDWAGWGLLAAGAIACWLFVVVERRLAYPMLKLELFFRNRHFRLASLSAMINYAASFALAFVMSLYLQYVKGLDADHAGFILMAQPVAQTILSPLAGRISDRINPSLLTTAGMAAICIGLVCLSRVDAGTPMYLIVAVLVLVGIGFAFFSSPNVNIIMGSVSTRDSGLASATTGTARQIGQAISMAMTSLIVHAYMGERTLSGENAALFLPAMSAAFLVFAVICLVGVYTSASKLFGDSGKKQWRHISVRIIPDADTDSEA